MNIITCKLSCQSVKLLCFSLSYIIIVMDLNDNTPMFTETSYSFSVAENTDQLMGIGVLATDPDLGSNSDIVYSITRGNENNAFVLGKQ